MNPPRLSILVVENNADTMKYLKMYLEESGHRVEASRTMEEALATLPQEAFDVMISDIGLSDGDGWELLEKAKPQRPLFAIAMSGFGTNADRARSLAAGYRHHLRKPFSPTELDPLLEEAARECAAAG